MLEFLDDDNYRRVNMHIVELLDDNINAALFLSELINRHNYHMNREELIDMDDTLWFFYTTDKCFERLRLSRKKQESVIKLLIEKDFIRVKITGLPARKHFSVNDTAVLEAYILLTSRKQVCRKDACQSVQKVQSRHYIKKNNIKEREDANASTPHPSPKKDRTKAVQNTPPKKSYGIYKKVRLTDEELERLRKDLTTPVVEDYIQRVDDQIATKKTAYTDHNRVIRNWHRRDEKKKLERLNPIATGGNSKYIERIAPLTPEEQQERKEWQEAHKKTQEQAINH